MVYPAARTREVTNGTLSLSESAEETEMAARRVPTCAHELGAQSQSLSQAIDTFLSGVARGA